MPTKSGRPTKRERQDAIRAKALQLTEKAIEGIGRTLSNPDAWKVLGGAVAGGTALLPQHIVFTDDFTEVRLFGIGTPPEEQKAARDKCDAGHKARNQEIEAEYQACVDACVRSGGNPDKILRCQERCEANRIRRQLIEDTRYFKCIDSAIQWTTTGAEYTFHFDVAVECYIHMLIPEFKVFLASTEINTRDAFLFRFKKAARPIRIDGGSPTTEQIELARIQAKESLSKDIRRDFLLFGVGGGAAGPLVADLLRAAAEGLKGVGEIVPG